MYSCVREQSPRGKGLKVERWWSRELGNGRWKGEQSVVSTESTLHQSAPEPLVEFQRGHYWERKAIMGVLLYMVSMKLNGELNIKVNKGIWLWQIYWNSFGYRPRQKDRDKVKCNWNDPFCENIHKGLWMQWSYCTWNTSVSCIIQKKKKKRNPLAKSTASILTVINITEPSFGKFSYAIESVIERYYSQHRQMSHFQPTK